VCQEQVVLLEFGDRPFFATRLEYEGARYVYLPGALNRLINAVERRAGALLRRGWSAERRLRQPAFASQFHQFGFALLAAWRARRCGCKVIHLHNFTQFAPVMRALNPKARILLHMHCEWLSQLDARMIGRRLESVDVVIACSGHVARKALARFPEAEDKFRILYNGSDVERFVPSPRVGLESGPDPLRILFVGRISPEKGVHVLVDAFARVAEQFPTARLELVGGFGSLPSELLVDLSDDPKVLDLKRFYPGDYHAQVRSQIPADVADRVVFHGPRSHQEISGHYAEAAVFVNASLSDAFPVPVVEAMGAGLPMAASAVGGIPEAVVHESTGLLVEPGNAGALAEALIRLLSDAPLRRRMGAAARQRALKLFSWRAIAEQVARVHAETGGTGCNAPALLQAGSLKAG
jgi:glycosyltransferase involved in cell wall biosynthesis